MPSGGRPGQEAPVVHPEAGLVMQTQVLQQTVPSPCLNFLTSKMETTKDPPLGVLREGKKVLCMKNGAWQVY